MSSLRYHMQRGSSSLPMTSFCGANWNQHMVNELRLSQPRRSLESCGVKGYGGKQIFIAGCSLGGCISVNAICREVHWASKMLPYAIICSCHSNNGHPSINHAILSNLGDYVHCSRPSTAVVPLPCFDQIYERPRHLRFLGILIV